MDTMTIPENQERIRNPDGTFVKGVSGNPAGRPKQKTMKEYAREWYLNLTDEQKTAYILAVEEKRPGFAWTMAEGNPEESKTLSITVPRPILGGISQAEQAKIEEGVVQEVLEAHDDKQKSE